MPQRPRCQPGEQLAHRRPRVGATEHDRVLEGGLHVGAGSQDEGVVAERVAARADDAVLVGIDGLDGGLRQLRVEIACHVTQRPAPRRAAAERLGHQHRPDDEVGVGRNEGDAHPLAGERAERDHRFQGGHASSDDEDLGRR